MYRFEGNIQNQIDPLGLFAPASYAGYALWGMLFGTAAHIGVQGTMEAVEESKQPSVSSTSETSSVSKCGKNNCCPPCEPYPAGTIGYQGPESHETGIFSGQSHYHIFTVNQHPTTCECRWNKASKKDWGHQYFGVISPEWINLNSSPKRPPDYPH